MTQSSQKREGKAEEEKSSRRKTEEIHMQSLAFKPKRTK